MDYLIKLVRDRVAAGFEHDRHEIVYEYIDDAEDLSRRLRAKLIEECAEYVTTGEFSELGDVLTVIETLAYLEHGKTLGDVLIVAGEKEEARGGFRHGMGMYAREIPNEEETSS